MTCECGGRLVSARLVSYDFSWTVGHKVAPSTKLTVDGYRCNECGRETPTGDAINMFVLGFNSGVLVEKAPR